ncbi:MAG: Deoxyguanosinetriphosphate triphosphohydrolase-like protein [Glaciecola sp. HTCC2999]|jgi:dGTPase|nr:MAG: Deoxyguanosinetriphosphate triphosphohydrolase-like protein [Glaciecola sp. HTCC2999]
MSVIKTSHLIWDQRHQPRTDSRDGDHRSAAQRDKARVMHSAAFRRLQAKTQIHGIGLSDFFRTRLTHSLEAAQIGAGITEQLRQKFPEQANLLSLDGHLIETICLAHDIGHPPFGHGGEIALNYMMRDYGGYEGNAQTFRIVSKLEPYTINNGMNLSRRTLLGLVKYPNYIDTLVVPYPACQARNTREITANAYIPPKGLYQCDATVFDWLLSGIDEHDRTLFMSVETRDNKHAKTLYKSFDCSIMELADDIAYGIHDLEDAIVMNKVTMTTFEQEVVKPIQESDGRLAQRIHTLALELFSDENYRRKNAIGALVNNFITAINITRLNTFKTNLLDYQAQLPEIESTCLMYFKNYIRKHVINNTEVQIMEYKGQQIVMELFQAFSSDPQRLLPNNTLQRWHKGHAHGLGERILADYIAGMTDEFASRMHQSLFSPTRQDV